MYRSLNFTQNGPQKTERCNWKSIFENNVKNLNEEDHTRSVANNSEKYKYSCYLTAKFHEMGLPHLDLALVRVVCRGSLVPHEGDPLQRRHGPPSLVLCRPGHPQFHAADRLRAQVRHLVEVTDDLVASWLVLGHFQSLRAWHSTH